MSLSRREISLLLPTLATQVIAQEKKDQQKEKLVLPAKAYDYAELPVKTTGENQGRAVFDGLTHTGYPVELHMTSLGPGQSPHAPHKHVNEEVLMLKNGRLDATFGGKTSRIEAGSVIYMASMEEHGWRNPGPEHAEYFVIALGLKS